MCGIAGFVDPTRDATVLKAMTDAIRRRGPDDSGHYLENGVGLGHRRLSIIDLSDAGHQPMEFGRLIIVFNGEIYNYREVRKELEDCGYAFTSSSDTEVILKAFDRWGPLCVERFIGMFAMAIYDRDEQALYLIRDRTGVKPLYYYHRGDRIAFGSELKCFRHYLPAEERNAISPAALSEFFAFGYISSNLSILEHVRKVPQGHYLRFQGGRMEAKRYWQVHFQPNEAWEARSEEDLLDELEPLAISAFRYRMVADVPVGVFLSAGIDSSLVSSVLMRHHGPIHTFTIGFDEAGYDESADARKIASHLGTNHKEAKLGPEKGLEILNRFYDIYDEPYGDTSGVPTTFVSELARDHGMKVVLSADGGDELFGGYTRYTEYLHRWRQARRLGALGRPLARLGLRAASALSAPPDQGRYGRFADLLRHDDFRAFYQNMVLNASVREMGALVPAFHEPAVRGATGAPLSVMCEWDFNTYMPDNILVKVDRASMYNSIEAREPFLDQRLIAFAAQLPNRFKIRDGETKYLLKRLLGRYLPESLYRLPKRGFGAPMAAWVREHYRDRFLDVLGGRDTPWYDRRALAALLDRYRSGQPVNYTMLWLLFSFQSWYDRWTAEE